MIRYALLCQTCDHEFEAWFGGADAYDAQKEDGLLACPACDSGHIEKQIMAPSVRTKSAASDLKKAEKTLKELNKKARDHIAENFDYVGTNFADEARAMHYGEIETRQIWGKASSEDSKALKDEGVKAETLPEAWAPPVPKNKDELN